MPRIVQRLCLHVGKPESAVKEGRTHKSHKFVLNFVHFLQVSNLVKIVERIRPGEESDYYLLHTIISLVNLAVGSEDLSPKERVILCSR